MRKKTIKFGLDNIFWYIIYLLPIILTIVQSIGVFENFTFEDWGYIASNTSPTDYGFMMLFTENLNVLGFSTIPVEIESAFEYLESLGWISNDYGPVITLYFWYFIACNILHLMVDFILFIPRLCHKWMSSFTKTED